MLKDKRISYCFAVMVRFMQFKKKNNEFQVKYLRKAFKKEKKGEKIRFLNYNFIF